MISLTLIGILGSTLTFHFASPKNARGLVNVKRRVCWHDHCEC